MMNKVLVAGAIALAIGLPYYQTYRVGSLHGGQAVQEQWLEKEQARTAEVLAVKEKLNQLVLAHQLKEKEYADAIQQAEKDAQDRVAAVHSDYAKRLLLAEDRAKVYQRRANGSQAEREHLARYAAELDRTVEEGRSLVRELGETIRQREVTIRALGGIILNDRTLLEAKE